MNNPLIYTDPTGEAVYYDRKGNPIADNKVDDGLKFIVTSRKNKFIKGDQSKLGNFEKNTIPVMSQEMRTKAKGDAWDKGTSVDHKERTIVQASDGSTSSIGVGVEGKGDLGPQLGEIKDLGKTPQIALHTHNTVIEEGKISSPYAGTSEEKNDLTEFTGIPSVIIGEKVGKKVSDFASGGSTVGKADYEVKGLKINSYSKTDPSLGQMDWDEYDKLCKMINGEE